MMRLRKLRRRLDRRVQDAQAEAVKSQERLDSARENVLTPLERIARDNNYARIIRDSILAGHDNGGA